MTPTETPSDLTQTLKLDRKTKGGRRVKIGLAVIGAALALIAGYAYFLKQPSQNGVTYKTQPVERGHLTVTVTATGTLEPTNQVDVSTELSGIIRSVPVDYNDRVVQGQVIATLDETKLQAEVMKSRAILSASRASLVKAQATVRESENELARLRQVRKLSGNKVPSDNDMAAAEAAMARAKADEAIARSQIEQNEASLSAIETDLSKTVIYSPINGIVLSRSIEIGQTVAASLQAPVLFTLAEDLTRMELHVDVDEADVGEVKESQNAVFTVDAYPDRSFTARITQVRFGAKTVDGVVTYRAVLAVENKDLSLRPGMTATADITVRRVENALLLPNAALRFSPPKSEKSEQSRGLMGILLPRPPRQERRRPEAEDTKGQKVYVLRNNQPVPVTIGTGATDGSLTEIREGDLKPGDPVIIGMSRVTS